MYLEMIEAGLPEPEYKVKDFMTILTIRNIIQKKITAIDNSLGKDLEKDLEKYSNLDLNDTQNKIVVEIIKNSKITQKQLAKLIGINERNIRNNIEVLKHKEVILRKGSDKGGYWELIKK